MGAPRILFLTHSEHADPGAVAAALAALGHDRTICCPMQGDALPALVCGRPEGFGATVVFGGPQSLSEIATHPYLETEAGWLGAQVRAGAPVLGICLGAQLIARALGAPVGPHPEGLREIGYHRIEPTAAGRAMFGESFHAYQWHREGFDLPAGAELLASGTIFPRQAYRIGERAYGLQFHPEMTREIMERWVTSEKGAPQLERPEAQSAAEQRAAAGRHNPVVQAWLARFLKDWLQSAA
jgi:GMP synthase (glutamine-hydrolysing)